MTRYIAFLRGINVGGKNIIKMNELSDVFNHMGFEQVKTFIQSGNVIFNSESDDSDQIAKLIEEQLWRIMEYEIPVIVRSVRALENLIGQDPFKSYMKDPELKLYVCFLKRRPDKIPPLPLISIKEGLEVFQISDLYAFIVSRKVKSMYGFPNNFIEKELRIPATTRNWNTIIRLIGSNND